MQEEDLEGAGDGFHAGHGGRLFACADRRAVFAPFTHVKQDERFKNVGDGEAEWEQDFGAPDCPPVAGARQPLSSADLAALSGRNRGVQGHQNSCYLDATLFAMFSFSRYTFYAESTAA